MEGGALLALALLAIGFLTLVPTGNGTRTTFCVICGPHAGADAVFNVALFLPIGAGLALMGTPWRIALAIGVGVSFVVELLQVVLPIGRVGAAFDLLMNVAGTAIGVMLMRRRRAILYPRSRPALRFAVGGGAAWAIILALTAVGLRPSLPAGGYRGQWSPDLESFDAHTGRVVSANLSGFALPDGPLARTDTVRTAMRMRTQLDAQAEFVTAHGRLAPIVRVVDERDYEVALLGQRGHDLLFRARVLASNLRLFAPGVVMFDALASVDLARPRLLPIDGQREGGRLRVSAYGREEVLRLHSGVGWMFLAPPASLPYRLAEFASALWIGAPLLAVGYWTGRRARRKARRAGDAFRLTGTGGQVLAALPALITLVIGGLAGVSFALELSIPGPIVWAGAFTAIGIGISAGIATALSHDDRAHGVTTAQPDQRDSISAAPGVA